MLEEASTLSRLESLRAMTSDLPLPRYMSLARQLPPSNSPPY